MNELAKCVLVLAIYLFSRTKMYTGKKILGGIVVLFACVESIPSWEKSKRINPGFIWIYKEVENKDSEK